MIVVTNDIVELHVWDTYGKRQDTIRYPKHDVIGFMLAANVMQMMGCDIGNQPAILKVTVDRDRGGVYGVNLLFASKDVAWECREAMEERPT